MWLEDSVMKALKQQAMQCGIWILCSDWGGYVYEIGDSIDTQTTSGWTLSSNSRPVSGYWSIISAMKIRRTHIRCYIVSCEIVVCSIFDLFMMNCSWQNVLDHLCSCAAGVHNCVSALAFWGQWPLHHRQCWSLGHSLLMSADLFLLHQCTGVF